jgi:hypothetical protein
MSPRVLAAVTLLGLAAGAASAAPTARFVATPIGGATCVAPCAVHFDATATSDPAYAREFHSLDYAWSFGDPGAGSWRFGAAAHDGRPWPKNHDVGPIAGHVYESASGSPYTVTLTVTNPAGETATATAQVVVVDPDAHFPDTDTYCFANDSRGFQGCPLDTDGDGACDVEDNCVVTSDFDLALTAGDSCNGSADCCDADAQSGRRCLFARGDTFAQDVDAGLNPANASPTLVSAFGAGPDPTVNVAGNIGWLRVAGRLHTLAHFDVNGDPVRCTGECDLIGLIGAARNTLVYDIVGRGFEGAAASAFADPGQPAEYALIEFDYLHAGTPGDPNVAGFFTQGSRVLVMGNRIDDNYQGEFTHRYKGGSGSTCGVDKSCSGLIAHNDYLRPHDATPSPPGSRNNLQVRGAHQYTVIQDNLLGNDDASQHIRTCGHDACGGSGQPECNADNTDILIAYNFAFRSNLSGAPATYERGFGEITGGDVTVRNNVIDVQGIDNTGPGTDRLVMHNECTEPGFNENNLHVLHNTLYFDDATTRNFEICGVGPVVVGTGHQCKGNLVYVPNQTGSRIVTTGNAMTEGNLFATANPFDPDGDGTPDVPPPQLSTTASDFRIGPGSAAVDAGPRWTGLTDHFVADDFFRGERPADAASDVGAHELGAAAAGRPLPPILLD